MRIDWDCRLFVPHVQFDWFLATNWMFDDNVSSILLHNKNENCTLNCIIWRRRAKARVASTHRRSPSWCWLYIGRVSRFSMGRWSILASSVKSKIFYRWKKAPWILEDDYTRLSLLCYLPFLYVCSCGNEPGLYTREKRIIILKKRVGHVITV